MPAPGAGPYGCLRFARAALTVRRIKSSRYVSSKAIGNLTLRRLLPAMEYRLTSLLPGMNFTCLGVLGIGLTFFATVFFSSFSVFALPALVFFVLFFSALRFITFDFTGFVSFLVALGLVCFVAVFVAFSDFFVAFVDFDDFAAFAESAFFSALVAGVMLRTLF
jgi:hypothetical protein